MTKRMLIDATHAEETRVVVLDGNRLEDYDVETSAKKQLKGNIYLARVVRVEPSLQAAFVEYGGNRHGFLAFGEIHPDYYQIPVADRQRLIELQEQEARAEEEAEDEGEGEGEAPSSSGAATAAAMPQEARQGPADDAAFGAGAAAADSGFGADTAPEAAEPIISDGAAADAAGAADDRVENVPTVDTPPPETVGGEGEGEGGEEPRERHVTPRFLRHYKIQEVIRRRQILLVQVVKEERGTKGAALTTYISLAGRYSVLMPNSPRGGGISRKITSAADRRRLKEVTQELDLPRGMGMIIRTAGANRPKPEIKRDCEYLLRLWDDIREHTLRSIAPALIYEEASLIKRAIRDVYSRDVEEVLVDGEEGWRAAHDFMRMLMPSHARKVQLWQDPSGQPLLGRYQVEAQLDAMLHPVVQLRSGGYLVINQTEALVAIDVNSGRSTRERGIEETALRTNLEAADEVARQLRLRDLAGLIVIDFIDMESKKHNAMVERRLKEALKNDRARIQVGHISHFGLMEMSRQRLRPSLAETSFVTCQHCGGTGHVRSTESAALHVLRGIEEEGAKRRAAEIVVHVAGSIAFYILNHKRDRLAGIESRYAMHVSFAADDTLLAPQIRIDRVRAQAPSEAAPVAMRETPALPPPPAEEPAAAAPPGERERPRAEEEDADETTEAAGAVPETTLQETAADAGDEAERRRRRRRRRRGGRRPEGEKENVTAEAGAALAEAGGEEESAAPEVTAEAPAPEGGAPSLDPSLAPQPDVNADFDTSMLAADAKPRRPRRGPRRRRDEAPASPAPEYGGPTPANPFGGPLDIFDAIEQANEQREPRIAAAEHAAAAPGAPAKPDPTMAHPEATVAPPEPTEATTVRSAAPAAPAAPEAPADEAPAGNGRASFLDGMPGNGMPGEETPAAGEAAPVEEPAAEPLIRPILVGAAPVAEKKRGWWRR